MDERLDIFRSSTLGWLIGTAAGLGTDPARPSPESSLWAMNVAELGLYWLALTVAALVILARQMGAEPRRQLRDHRGAADHPPRHRHEERRRDRALPDQGRADQFQPPEPDGRDRPDHGLLERRDHPRRRSRHPRDRARRRSGASISAASSTPPGRSAGCARSTWCTRISRASRESVQVRLSAVQDRPVVSERGQIRVLPAARSSASKLGITK